MTSALPLRAALKRGALLTGANWPVVLIEFTIESLYKTAIGVPIVGGAIMVAVVFGVLTILRPGVTLIVLILRFGGYAIVNGIFTIITAVANRHGESRWGSLLVSGVLSIAFGIAAFLMPDITAVLLLYIIAGWAILTGAESPPTRGWQHPRPAAAFRAPAASQDSH